MSDRNLTAGVTAETEAAQTTAVAFVELDFASGPVRCWTGVGPVTAAMPGEAAVTWEGVGDLGRIEAVAESSDRRQNGVRFALSGVNNALLGTALTEDYQGRRARMWIAFVDAAGAIIADPVPVFGGLMDVMETADGDATGTITLDCESREAQLARASTSLLTDQEQQRLYPGDRGLEFVQELQSKEILWGAPSPMPASGPGPGSSISPRFFKIR